MSNLLIEIGNTALKAAYAQGLTLGKTFRYQGERKMEFIASVVEKEEKPELMVVSCVNSVSAEEEEALRCLCGSLIVLDSAHTDILRAYGFPEYLTYDRAASMIAVRHLFKGQKCIVFDFGTTVSIDFLSLEGEYLGGNISLGCRTRFKALNRYARVLPLVNTPKEIVSRGTSTLSSIESGIISGMVFEIEGYVSQSPGSVVIFTGGDAEYFAKQTKNPTFIVCNLVLMGLASIAQDYVEEK